jgi:hypothetical protein
MHHGLVGCLRFGRLRLEACEKIAPVAERVLNELVRAVRAREMTYFDTSSWSLASVFSLHGVLGDHEPIREKPGGVVVMVGTFDLPAAVMRASYRATRRRLGARAVCAV